MLNFTVGPVMSSEQVLAIGSEQVPYFRTPEFSELMMENERLIIKFAKAGEGSRVVFVTGSGTASMEATIMNVFTHQDKVLIVNGGSFGQRFVELCKIHDIPHDVINLNFGESLKYKHLELYENNGYTGFLVNVHETSTGVRYDIDLISDFCKRNNLFLVVDAISSFLADSIDTERLGIDVMITGSQKALACPPGVSIITLSRKGVERVMANNPQSLYFDLRDALRDGERGQTPFTPAVGILRQINTRLHEIDVEGVESEIKRIGDIARDFRKKIKGLPFEIFSESLSNAVTPLHPTTASAYDIFIELKDHYGIWICPNGGELKEKVFRVGHIGHILPKDNTTLIEAFLDLKTKGFI